MENAGRASSNLDPGRTRRVYYVTSEKLLAETDRIPVVPQRASMVHSLIESYGLLEHMTVVQSKRATVEDLKLYHSTGYIDCLKNFDNEEDEDVDVDEEQVEYGLGYDCTPVKNMLDLVSELAGGSLTATDCLLNDENGIAVNWCGGWHHAHRDEAEGFCYVNDIVVAIEKLRRKYPRVLYIDLDVHHGNGVENSYAHTKRVFTLSFHRYETGFYPCSGSVKDIGAGDGKGYCCNVPMHRGYSDSTLIRFFKSVVPDIVDIYKPNAIVVQCGSDCLNGDPLGESNVTFEAFESCIRDVLDYGKPTLFLGGGGYDKANAARLWTQITGMLVGRSEDVSPEIPDHEFFLEYKPDYYITIDRGYQKDTNSEEYILMIIDSIKKNLNYLRQLENERTGSIISNQLYTQTCV